MYVCVWGGGAYLCMCARATPSVGLCRFESNVIPLCTSVIDLVLDWAA